MIAARMFSPSWFWSTPGIKKSRTWLKNFIVTCSDWTNEYALVTGRVFIRKYLIYPTENCGGIMHLLRSINAKYGIFSALLQKNLMPVL